MRRLSVALVILLTLTCGNNSFAGCVAEYLMEEGSAGVVGDTSGSANSAYFVNSPVWQGGYGGESQHCLDFDGSNYLEARDSTSLDSITTGFTMTAWIKADQDSISDTIVWKVGAFRIWKNNAALKVSLTGANVTDIAVIPGGITNGVWHHVAVTYDGMYITGYLDGVYKRSFQKNVSSVSIATSNNPLYVGWYNSGSYHYRGSLDNVRLYNNALSNAEIIADMSDDTTPTQPLAIVQSGVAVTAIIIPTGTTIEVETVAANELQYHIQQATGVTLAIYEEINKPATFSGLIYIGACNATAAAGIEGSYLDDNAYVARNVDNDFFLAGHDSSGNPLGMLYGNDTRIGTMLAVYKYLEKYMGVKWLWPGHKGEIIPATANIVASDIAIIGKPVLKHTRLNDYNTWNWGGGSPSANGWASTTVRDNYLNAQSLWMRRQGFCTSINLNYSHAFGDWWDNYGPDSDDPHLEYFNLLPDGTRRPDPYHENGRTDLVSMDLSEPNFHSQIVDNWIAAGALGYIPCGENDTAVKCTCLNCIAWDVESANFQSEYGCPWSQRLTYATNAFNAGQSDWYKYLGSMSTRLAKYLLAIQQKAESRGYVDATISAFAYANYKEGPLGGIQLNDRVVMGIVPSQMFPWTDAKQQAFRGLWDGWTNAGAQAFLRPNYFLEGHNLPINFARRFGADFLYALRRGMIGTIFDSLTGQWSTQSINLYMLARVQTHVSADWENWGADVNGDGRIDMADLAVLSNWWLDNVYSCDPGNRCGDINGDGNVDLADFVKLAVQWHNNNAEVESIVDEFYEPFGPAKSAVRTYFDYMEAVSSAATVSPSYSEWYVGADEIFTSSVMANGRTLITNAQTAAAGDPVAVRLVDFLEKGFTNAEKTLAAHKAWEDYINNGALWAVYLPAWQAAHADLVNYRASVEADFICNMGWLDISERRVWQY